MERGKFIVIEGTDGSGKTTQFEKLVLRVESPVALFDFPQYDKPSSFFVKEYLAGHYGTAEEVGPYKASLFYAIDRFDVAPMINKALTEGKTVFSNRYVGSNMGHQGAKIEDKKERLKYFNWLYDLEYNIFGIPKPDLNIVLHVPAKTAQEFASKQNKGGYAAGEKRDIHEGNLKHLEHAEMVYLEMSEIFPKDFQLVECVENGKLLSIDAVHEKVWKAVSKILK
ncbi:MAG: thymidylate kinase [Patescibacteria group bacterium]